MTTDERPHTAVAVTRSGRWWAISDPTMPNVHSQYRRLEQLDDYAREAIALALDVSPDDVGQLDVSITPPIEVAEAIEQARRRASEADAARTAAAQSRLETVTALATAGYPTRDIGVLLGLSHQRVSQLLTEAR